MKIRTSILTLCLVLGLLLGGCRQSTTVILPPDTTPANTQPTETATEEATTSEPTEEITASTEPTTAATAPSTSAPTEAKTEPTAAPTPPSTEPKTEPTSAPTEPSTEPTTEATTAATEPDVYDISNHSVGSLEREILAELNARRAAEGISPLSLDSQLSALAAIRSYECTKSFSHTRPDGRDCFSVLDDYGYSGWTTVGENLLYCSSTYSVSEIVDAWMNSQGHRANILSSDFTLAGIGVYTSGGLIYVANFFAG